MIIGFDVCAYCGNRNGMMMDSLYIYILDTMMKSNIYIYIKSQFLTQSERLKYPRVAMICQSN